MNNDILLQLFDVPKDKDICEFLKNDENINMNFGKLLLSFCNNVYESKVIISIISNPLLDNQSIRICIDFIIKDNNIIYAFYVIYGISPDNDEVLSYLLNLSIKYNRIEMVIMIIKRFGYDIINSLLYLKPCNSQNMIDILYEKSKNIDMIYDKYKNGNFPREFREIM